jgi:hypothetical protein
MGFFKDAAEHLGAVDHKLIASGILARGDVVKVEPTAFSSGGDKYDVSSGSTVCKVTVTVSGVPGQAPYQASFLAPIPESQIGILEMGGAAVAVRVDQTNPQNIALDSQTEAPDVTASAVAPANAAGTIPADGIATEHGAQIVLTSNDGTQTPLAEHMGKLTAAEVLAQGKPCTVDVLAIIPIDQKNLKGEDMTGLILNVHRTGQADVQAQIGTHVPPELLAKVVVGATLPAKYTPGLDTGDDTVIPDWASISA